MDLRVMKHRQQPYDPAGAWVRSGNVNPELLARLLDDDNFSLAAPKITGFEHFKMDWLRPRLTVTSMPPADVQATLCELTAATIADVAMNTGLARRTLHGQVGNLPSVTGARDSVVLGRISPV
jgi:anhydro-N-acetylmuramic acid kinase